MKLIDALVIVETTLLLLSRINSEVIVGRKRGYADNVMSLYFIIFRHIYIYLDINCVLKVNIAVCFLA